MTESANLCRLCVDILQDSKSLYDENGCGNELYDITLKYFHPLIVNMDEAKHLTDICLQCWQCLRDFESFQTAVLMAQLKLVEAQPGATVKIEQGTQGSDTATYVAEIGAAGRDEAFPFARELPEQFKVSTSYEIGAVAEDKGEAFPFIRELPEQFKVSTDYISLPKLEIMDVDSEDDGGPTSAAAGGTDNRGKKHESVDDLLAKWMPNIGCTACPEYFTNLSLLEDHFRQSHPNTKFFIICCSRELTKRVQIRDHLLLHNNPDAFKCHLCEKSYANRQCLRQHMIQAHPEYQKFVCEICGFALNTKGGLKCHYTTVHKMDMPPQQHFRPDTAVRRQPVGRSMQHTCEQCGKVFHKESSLQRHVWNNHKLVPKHKCSFCGVRFKTPVSMREHVAHVHHQRDLYACVFCPKTFSKLNTIFQHRKRMHPNESNRNYYYRIDEVEKDTSESAGQHSETDSKGASTSGKTQDDGYAATHDTGDDQADRPESDFGSDKESDESQTSEDVGSVERNSHSGNNMSADRRLHMRDNHRGKRRSSPSKDTKQHKQNKTEREL